MQSVPELDIVVPVFNEGELISSLLDSLRRGVKTPWRLLICYDLEGDDTLPAIERYPHRKELDIEFVKNPGRGPNSAVIAGFRASRAPAVLTFTADDDYNAVVIDSMVQMVRDGYDVVTGSRFIPGGSFEGCAWPKAVLFPLVRIHTVPEIGRPRCGPLSTRRRSRRRRTSPRACAVGSASTSWRETQRRPRPDPGISGALLSSPARESL